MELDGKSLSLETARKILIGYSCAPVSRLNPLAVPPSIRTIREMFSYGLPVYCLGDGALLADAAMITAKTLPSLYIKGADFERAIRNSGQETFSLLRLESVLDGKNCCAESKDGITAVILSR